MQQNVLHVIVPVTGWTNMAGLDALDRAEQVLCTQTKVVTAAPEGCTWQIVGINRRGMQPLKDGQMPKSNRRIGYLPPDVCAILTAHTSMTNAYRRVKSYPRWTITVISANQAEAWVELKLYAQAIGDQPMKLAPTFVEWLASWAPLEQENPRARAWEDESMQYI